MRTALRVVPLILSSLVIAAHFYRSGNIGFVVFALVAPTLLLARERWSVRVVQVLLAIAALEWVRTALSIARERAMAGAPSTRMFIILGAVALFTLLAAVPLKKIAAA